MAAHDGMGDDGLQLDFSAFADVPVDLNLSDFDFPTAQNQLTPTSSLDEDQAQSPVVYNAGLSFVHQLHDEVPAPAPLPLSNGFAPLPALQHVTHIAPI